MLTVASGKYLRIAQHREATWARGRTNTNGQVLRCSGDAKYPREVKESQIDDLVIKRVEGLRFARALCTVSELFSTLEMNMS